MFFHTTRPLVTRCGHEHRGVAGAARAWRGWRGARTQAATYHPLLARAREGSEGVGRQEAAHLAVEIVGKVGEAYHSREDFSMPVPLLTLLLLTALASAAVVEVADDASIVESVLEDAEASPHGQVGVGGGHVARDVSGR